MMERVGEWASRDLRSVAPDASAREVVEEMNAGNTRHLLVFDQGRLAGIISNRDMVRVVFKNPGRVFDIDGCRAADIMTPAPLETIEAGADLSEAARRMYEAQVSALPVMDEGRVVGVISVADLLRLVWLWPAARAV